MIHIHYLYLKFTLAASRTLSLASSSWIMRVMLVSARLRPRLVLCDNFYEPSYESGKAVRWKIESADQQPFGIACLWDRWTDPSSGELIVSFSMLTVNADEHPVMKQFHKPGDEKRTPVIISAEYHAAWLGAELDDAQAWMSWQHMPALVATASPRIAI